MTRVLQDHDDEDHPVSHNVPRFGYPPGELHGRGIHERCGRPYSEHDQTRSPITGTTPPWGCPPERDAALSEEAEAWAAEDAVEAEWRERYPDADELELRRLSGDR